MSQAHIESVVGILGDVLGQIADHAEQTMPYEAVGLVLECSSIYTLRNEAAEPEHAFYVGRDQLDEASLDIRDLLDTYPVALYHSHPSGVRKPSPTDMNFFREFQANSILAIYGAGVVSVYQRVPDPNLIIEHIVDIP